MSESSSNGFREMLGNEASCESREGGKMTASNSTEKSSGNRATKVA
jgi:hypothetical protein